LLTGTPAGEMSAEGTYPEGTIYARVQAKLSKYAENLKEEGGEEEEEKDPVPDEEEGESAASDEDAPDSGEEDEL